MTYISDGSMEPRVVDEVDEYIYPDYMGYEILVKLWTDGQYTLHIEQDTLYGYVDFIENGEYDYDTKPSVIDVQEKIDEILEERFDRSIENG
jgi:hypothetical protein